jgi:tetratricopeptide (TPR) repeat protein
MKRAVFFVLSFFAISTFSMAAPVLSVSYVDGTAYVQSNSQWKTLSIGDPVPADARIRLDAGASVQLKGIGADIYLAQKGIYFIRDLLAARQKLRTAGIGRVLIERMDSLLTGPAHNQSAVAGVRGADESKSSDPDWVTSTQDNIQEGENCIQSGEYDKAIEKLTQALDEATEEELPPVHVHLAYAYFLSGDSRDAARQLAGLKPAGSWAGDYILLRAMLYLDTFAFTQEIQWLTQAGNDLSGDEQRAPIYYYLLGLGYRGAGDVPKETQSLSKVVSFAGENDLVESAAGLLRNP